MLSINMKKTGTNISKLMVENNTSVRDIQSSMGFNTPQAVYKWKRGESIPNIDNLFVLSEMFNCKIEDIVIVDRY